MTRKQKLQIEQSEKRERLNALLAKDELTDDERGEMDALTKRMQEIEPELRAAIVAEGDTENRIRAEFGEDREGAELRALIAGADLGTIFESVIEHRATDGREAELQGHYKIGANQVPLAMLRRADPVETRAVTPAPANVGQNQAAIIPGVFPQACASFLSVDMPTVPTGEAVYPVLTTNASVTSANENAAVVETTGSFAADVLSPRRLQASFFYSREDRARFAGMDESLRMNLGDALADALDKEVLAGTNGLFEGTNLANHNVTTETTYALYRSQLAYGRVDGTYAAMVGDLRIVMGSATYAHASGEFRSTNAGDRAALEDLMEVTGGVKVSAHVPAVSGNKQNAVIRLGMRRDMVAPIWEGVTLIPDEVTKAANGQIVLTAVMLHAVKILRAAGFYKQQTQHA
ncbi:MAG: phage major capsid protein [Rhodospirillaceae bacterium]|nr:phage major capsid protein [Rhodospirillaceae bacterium]